MSYEKQTFTNGEVLTAEQLNRMSKGISDLQDRLDSGGEGDELNDHLSDKDNPHKVVPEQIGAVRIADFQVLEADLGETSQMLISHQDDEGNPHGVTAEQAGAAPAGYGLGERKAFGDNWNGGFVNAFTRSKENSPDKKMWYGLNCVNGQTDSCAAQIAFSQEAGNLTTEARRTRNAAGILGEWEYVNPPMREGVEYRTTERWGGKPVYKMLGTDGKLYYRIGDGEAQLYSELIGAQGENGTSGTGYISGTTDEITPSQVAEAINKKQYVYITYDDTDGTITFSAFVLLGTVYVVSSTFVIDQEQEYANIVQLLGDLDTDTWNISSFSGLQGEPGQDGLTPFINSGGNWQIGNTDTGVKATGATGTDGVSITKTEINNNGELVITLSNDTVSNLGVVVGEKGGKGEKGEPGHTPVKGVDYWTETDTEEIEDDLHTYISEELAKLGQLRPEFANNIAECTDTSKLYVLPDGYIYGYIKSFPTVTYEVHENKQWSGSAQLMSTSGIQAKNTNIIPVKEGDKFIYTGNGKWNASVIWLSSSALNPNVVNNAVIVSVETYGSSGAPETVTVTAPSGAKYVMFASWDYNSPGVFLEVTPLTGSATWASTGHAFVPTDYEDRIIALEHKSNVIASKLKDKKIVYDGDSIAESRVSGVASNGGGYAKLVADKVGGTYSNQAVGGAYLRSTTIPGKHSVVDNLANLPKDGDLYCFEGGINDYWNNATLGTFSKTDFTGSLDTSTVCGAMETIFRYALTNFVGKPICFVIVHKIQSTAYTKNASGNTFEDYRNAMVGICNKYSIPYYDAFSESGLNGWNTAQNNAFLTANANGTADGTHPNEGGYKRYYVPQLIQLFERIIPT